jgi:predicted AAA+ superfamily ATPase
MKLFLRDILKKIRPFYDRKEAVLIRGMRRVGKTTLLQLIKKELIAEKNISEKNIYFFDLEDLDLRDDFNQSPKNLLKYLENIGDKKKKYVFIDEIQYLDNPSNFLKILVDHYPELKIFTTGSSSLEIKKKIQDSLVGRVMYFQLYPLNFSEFLLFKEEIILKENLTDNQKKKFDLLLEEFLIYGGMPEIVLENNIKIKKQLLKNYLNLYITKDIKNLTEIKNLSTFNKLAKILASQVGNVLNKSDLANRLDANLKTIERYFDILKHTFLVISLPPYFSNTVSQLIKSKKLFFYDLGLRNALLGDFTAMEFRNNNGAIFENFILLELLAKFAMEDIFFYRTQQGTEIDFVINSEKAKMTVEAKYSKLKKEKVFRVFKNFSEFDNQVVNLNFNRTMKGYQFIDWRRFLMKINELN